MWCTWFLVLFMAILHFWWMILCSVFELFLLPYEINSDQFKLEPN